MRISVAHILIDLEPQTIINNIYTQINISEQNKDDILILPLMHSKLPGYISNTSLCDAIKKFIVKQDIKINVIFYTNVAFVVNAAKVTACLFEDEVFGYENNFCVTVIKRNGIDHKVHIAILNNRQNTFEKISLSGEPCSKGIQIVFDNSHISRNINVLSSAMKRAKEFVDKCKREIVWAFPVGFVDGRVYSGGSFIVKKNDEDITEIFYEGYLKADTVTTSGQFIWEETPINQIELMYESLKFCLKRTKKNNNVNRVMMCMDGSLESYLCAVIASEVFHPYNLFFHSVVLAKDDPCNMFLRDIQIDSNSIYWESVVPSNNLDSTLLDVAAKQWSYCISRIRASKMHRAMLLEHRKTSGEVSLPNTVYVSLFNGLRDEDMRVLMDYVRTKYGNLLIPEEHIKKVESSRIINGPSF